MSAMGKQEYINKTRKTFKTIPQTTLRRLRNTPTYFFVVWRWSFWLYALAWIWTSSPELISLHAVSLKLSIERLLLGITLIQTLAVTLYTPVFQPFLPRLPWIGGSRLPRQRKIRALTSNRRRLQPLAADEEPDIVAPLVRARNPYWDYFVLGLDVLICGLAVYYSAPFWVPIFGDGSPFYRYGLSTVLVAAFTYRYRGGLAAALGYDLFMLLGAYFPPPLPHEHYVLVARDLVGSLLDAPVVAVLAAYMATLLGSYTRSKRREQDAVRRRRALLGVSETLLQGASDEQSLLQRSAEQIRKGGHFGRLVVALVAHGFNGANSNDKRSQLEIASRVEVGLVEAASPERSEALLEQVVRSGERLITFEPLNEEENETTQRIARLYLPFFKDGQVYVVLGAESIRQTAFDKKQEEFLAIVGAQLVVALENMRLTEQTAELAAVAERGRIAREIHDGIAQLIYMLSLNTETCVALAHRIEEASEDDAELISPLTQRLEKLITISKQALWETRHYMFTLKPLISGTTTLTEMLTNQLHEFEAISGLPIQLEVEGSEERPEGDQRKVRTVAQVGTAIFRITQEALTNAYKHANATAIRVYLRHQPGGVEVEICDNGKGLEQLLDNYDRQHRRIYSGHGIYGMRERAEELGGTFEVRQAPGGGVSVRACFLFHLKSGVPSR
jgi:signal transduction histidine kinase